MSFKDHFSGHAAIYHQARPTYPPELFAWLAKLAPDTELAWDCGCGNGQATLELARHFARVVGTDPSVNQIANAEARANVEYRVESAEHSSFERASVSLITVAQALHWFDPDRYYREARRVLKPGGIFSAWCYADCRTGDDAVDTIKDHLYIDLTGSFWPPERALVDSGYGTLPFPFVKITAPEFPMSVRWNVEQMLAYFRSWSATQSYLKIRNQDPVGMIEADLRKAWGDDERTREVQWTFHLRVGRA
jgi:SAM-dependent methyltransferase